MISIKKIGILVTLLTSMFVLNGCSEDSSPDTPTVKSDFEYSLIGDEAHLEGYNGESTDVVIPSTLESDGMTYNVVSILNAFNNRKDITSVVIPNSVTTINDEVFKDCINLKTVTLSENLSKIGKGLFEGATSLESITIPNNVTSIELYAFKDCTSLTNINLSDSLDSIDSTALINCSSLESITIPSTLSTVSADLFEGCDSLTGIYVEEDHNFLSSLDGNLYNLAQTELIKCAPANESITISKDVTKINSSAFNYCNQLETVTIDSSNTTYKAVDGIIYSYSLDKLILCAVNKASVTIETSVTTIEQNAFEGLTLLESITIPNNVTVIGGYAFRNCTSLEEVTLPNNLQYLNAGAFQGCTSLKTVVLPETLTTISNSAFKSCTSLESITIPSNLTSIELYAFMDCTSLESITIPASVTTINDAFSGCTSLTIYTPLTEQPTTWYSNWNSSNCEVKWGQTAPIN